jgi:hypothetical protein
MWSCPTTFLLGCVLVLLLAQHAAGQSECSKLGN